MRKIFALIIATLFVLTACGTPSNDTSNDATVSNTDNSLVESTTDESKADEITSNEETSSKEEATPVFKEIDGVKYYDVKASGAGDALVFTDPFTGAVTGDHSKYFVDDVEGYYLDDMVFLVDESTFYKVLSKPVAGTGSIKWIGYKDINTSDYDPFDGLLPVEKMDDPLYVYMCKPSERKTVMNRVNASNMKPAIDDYINALSIGAIYPNPDKPLPDDAEFTLCFGRTTMIFYTEDKGWFMGKENATPAAPKALYYLPWELEHTVGVMSLPSDRVSFVDGHLEVKMKGSDLNGSAAKEAGATGAVCHIWGSKVYFDEFEKTGSEILGLVSSYEAWIKEPEWAEYVVAAVAVDWRAKEEIGIQAYSGHNYALTTEPRVIFGHNVGPKMYDKIMDTEKVQELLELK